MPKNQYNEKQITGRINSRQGISGRATPGAGVTDHNRLYNRDAADQHPIEAITDLRDELDSKLDAKTALPLIHEALQSKAAGLYYDAAKEFAKKAYWYLCSEIDPVTKMGTRDSIISGPYDLGQGGGGGGGVTKVTISLIDWPTTVVVGSTVNLSINWSSVIGDPAEPTGPGTIYVAVNNKQVIIKPNQAQGLVTFDIGPYLTSGNNSIKVTVLDAYGTQGIKVSTINTVSLELTSNFNYNLNFSEAINYTYTPWGNVDKTVHFIVDGAETGTQLVKSSGEQQTYRITGLHHGSHTLKVYFTAVIDGAEVQSNELFYDLVYYEAGNSTPIIVSAFDDTVEREQYIPFSIPYRVFIWNRNSADIQLIEDGTVLKDLTVNFDPQSWDYKSDVPAIYTLQIKCGTTIKTFNVHIVESQIQVLPVQENLALALSAQGRSNNEPIETRSTWRYEDISCTMTDFNWSSNGWVKDSDDNTVLRLSGDARVVIPYKPFETEFKNIGKTIELEIATSSVMNYSSSIIQCLDKTSHDFFETSMQFVDLDTRPNIFDVETDYDTLVAKGLPIGSIVFSYTAAGWTLDGEIVDLADYGITLIKKTNTGEESDEFVLVGDSIVLTHDTAARGFYVTPQIAALRSQQISISSQYKEDDHVRLAFVIEKASEGTRIVWMYINGIASGAVRYPNSDIFSQDIADNITIGSNDAVVDIYNIRIYNNNLTSKQIVNNWIADTQNAALKAQRYYHNDNYNDRNELVIEKLPSDLPYMIWDIDPLPISKDDRRPGNVAYVDPASSARGFEAKNAEYRVQGTSSAGYPVKNIRIKYKQIKNKQAEAPFEWYDNDGNPIKKYAVTEGGIADNYFTYKVDFASSEGANNVELVKLYNDACKKANILTPPQRLNSKVRVGIDGFPIIAFWQDADGNITFNSKANFNNDKANEKVYGFETTGETWADGDDQSWETLNNTSNLAKFKEPVTAYNFDEAFEIRFPDDDYTFIRNEDAKPGTPEWEADIARLTDELTELTRMTTWVSSTYRRPTDSDEVKRQKLATFKNELADYFDVNSTLFYYLFTEMFLMVDSRAKNAFPTYFKSRQANDGGDRWFWIPYDMDTAIGINNEGKLVFDYSLEDIDQVSGADVFNGQDSVMWCNVRDAFQSELADLYIRLRNDGLFSYDYVEKLFEEHQSKWSENIFNEDAKKKYIDPLSTGNNYLPMLQGAKAEQRRWWLYNRFKYLDSKYGAPGATASENRIYFRAYVEEGVEKPNITITPYADIYASVSFTNGQVTSKRAKRNIPIIIENPYKQSEKETDQETYIYSASQLKSIGDISGFFPAEVTIGPAIKLQELKVGDATPGYENTHLERLEFGNNALLKKLDVRNCIALAQPIEVTNCINLEEIYFDNTKITGIELPDGGNIKVLHLPNTLTNLTVKNQPLLNDFVLAGTENLSRLWLENIPSSSINAYDLISEMSAGRRVRLIGINETYDDPDDAVNLQKIEQFYNLLDTMKGINADGEDTEKAQVTGTINLPRISYADRVRLMARYPEVNINATIGVICKVDFKVEASSTEIIVTRLPYAGETVIAPADPTKEPTQAKTYRFNHWEYLEDGEAKVWTAETVINTDLVIYGIYDELDREYTVRFNPLSYVVTVEPRTRQVVFNTTFDAPTVSGIPAHVTLSGWYTAENLEWDFETMKIQSDITLFAHWTDESKPVVSAVRVNYNTFSFTAHDNLGIAAYAITRTNETPTDWIDIPDAPVDYNNTYVINASGSYYVWVKDTVGNVVDEPARMVAFDVVVTKATGSEISIHEDVTEFNTAYALFGTALHVAGTIDSHYENLKLYINNLTSENPVDIMIESNTTIRSTCDPKIYTVSFNMMGQGTQISPEHVIYLHTCPQPAAQYTPGFIIGGWYTESELINRWVFETTPIEGDVTLYAKWEEYRAPSEFDIVIPAISLDDPDREARRTVRVNFWQAYEETVKVDWGDGSPLDTHPVGSGAAVSVSHIYEVDDDHSTPYTIKVYGPTGDYAGMYGLGGGFANPIVECYSGQSYNNANYVKAVRFAADLSATSLNSYALRGAQITDLCLTPYITTLVTGMYRECTALTNITIPDWVTLIGQQVFMSCDGLQAVTISDTVREIDNEAFYGCSQLATVNMNAETSSLTFIGHAAFMGAALTHFRIPKNVTAFCWRPGFMPIHDFEVGDVFSSNTTLTTAGPYGATDHLGNPVTVEYPWSDRIIDYFGWNTLEEVIFPAGLTSIGKCAFYGARLSGTIDLSSYALLTEIKDFAFLDDALSPRNSIIEFKLPSSLVTLGKEVFENCRNLNKINIPVNVRNIGRAICYSCWNLTDVIINTTALISGKIELEADAWFKDSNRYCILRVDSSILDHHYSTFGSEWDAYRIEGVDLIRLTVVAIDDGE